MRHGKQTAAFFLAAAMVMSSACQLYLEKSWNLGRNRK